jgi:hypothetical protein
MASRLLFLCARGSSRALLAASIEPSFGMQWDEGIVLRSGATGT